MILEPITDRGEWLAWRRGGIGASDIAAIDGTSPFATPYQVWLDKTGGAPETEASISMELGNVLERWILDRYATMTGVELGYHQWRGEDGIIRCTFDAIGTHPVDAKATSYGTWDEVPAHYQAQAQMQMYLAGADMHTFAVLHDRRAVELYDTERDDDEIARLIETAHRFWAERVEPGVMPEPTGDDLPLLRRRPTPTDEPVATADDVIANLVEQVRQAKATTAAAKQWEDTLTARLAAAIGDATELVDRAGRTLATWKAPRTFDAERAITEHPDLAAACTTVDLDAFRKALGNTRSNTYMTPGDSRRLNLKETG